MHSTQLIDKSTIPVLILAGGFGTRLSEETTLKPKPMVEVGGRPMLWHIMKCYSHYGFKHFVICAGYKSWMIKDFISKLTYYDANLKVQFGKDPVVTSDSNDYKDWTVQIIDTGEDAMTGFRVCKTLETIGIADDQVFALTYGDGLSDVNLDEELSFFIQSGKTGIILGVRPRARFGILVSDEQNIVKEFKEKPQSDHDLINGGFLFLKGSFKKYLDHDVHCVLEGKPLERIAADNELMVYKHFGFWQCMDTIRDKNHLQEEWRKDDCKWRVWQ